MMFNINDNVRVRLTEHGRKVLQQKRDELMCQLPHTPLTSRTPDSLWYNRPLIQEDEDGWSEWQMWNLIETFGDYIGMEMPNVFDLTIEIKDEYLHETTTTQ